MPGRRLFSGMVIIVLSMLTIPADTADYSEAFEGLRALGLPDNKAATYVTLSPAGQGMGYYGERTYAPFANELYNLKIKGNAWLIEENKESKTFSVILFNREITTFSTASSSKKFPVAAWKKADPKTDLTAILKYLDEDKRVGDMIGYSDDLDSKLLLAAAQFHRFGLKKEANLFAARTLAMVKDKNKSITNTISVLANGKYHSALKRVPETGDWKAFADTCASIVKKFGRGWNAANTVTQIAEKARSQPTAPPPLKGPAGIALTKRHQTLASEISTIRKTPAGLEYLRNLPWILLSDEMLDQYFPPSEESDDQIFRKIIKGGMDSVPMLLAMMEDDTFLLFSLAGQSEVTMRRMMGGAG